MNQRRFFKFSRQSRLFEKGDLKYVILNFLKDKSSHGYEIIRALEDLFHGCYSPSAGSVYPTLQMLNDMGYVSSTEQDGKKIYTITDEGKKFLKDQRDVVDKIECQMKDRCGHCNSRDFRDTIQVLRHLGSMISHRAHRIDDKKWVKIKEIVTHAHRDVEDILGK